MKIHFKLIALISVGLLILSGCLTFTNPVTVLDCDSFVFTYDEISVESLEGGSDTYGLRVVDGTNTVVYDDPTWLTTTSTGTLPGGTESGTFTRQPQSTILQFEVYDTAIDEIQYSERGVCVNEELEAIDLLPAFTDGRINDYDAAAPIAIYPMFIDGELGLEIRNPDGNILLTVTQEQLLNAPLNPETNVLIAEDNGVALYRITGSEIGLWQINAPQYNGKTYVIIFSEPYSNADYVSYEE